MSPGLPPPFFRVSWDDETENDVAAAVLAYFPMWEGIRVTRAEQVIEYLLGDDPERNGLHASEGLYTLTVSPLKVQYEILHLNRVVRVLAVRHFPV